MFVKIHRVTTAVNEPTEMYINEDLIGGIVPTNTYRGQKRVHELFLRETKPYSNNPLTEAVKTITQPIEIIEQTRDFAMVTLGIKTEKKPNNKKEPLVICPACGHENIISKMIWKKGMANCQSLVCKHAFKRPNLKGTKPKK